MDNVPCLDYIDPNTGEVYELLPREEVLARLYELLCVYEARVGHRTCPVAADRGEPPHAFGYGCCRAAAAAAASTAQLERAA